MAELNSLIDIEIRSQKAVEGSRKVVDSLNKIDKANDKVQKETKETAQAFEKSGARIASSTGEVDKRFKKVAKSAKAANKDIKGLGGGVKSISESMGKLAKFGLASLIASFAATGLSIAASIKGFATFQQSIADLSAITGAAGNDLKFFEDAAREMGAATTLSASEVADAFRLVASAKPDLLESASALKAVTASAITLAEAAGITVPEAANTMASALNQFGQEADQATRFTNVLAAGSKFGAASIAEMGEAMKFAGVASANFGLSFEETNAALQLLSTNAIKGGEAGTQLKGVLLNLETKMADKFRPSVVGFAQAMENLRDANLSAEESVKLFGSRNFIAGQIFADNTDKIKELTEAVTGTSIAQEQASIRTDTLEGATARLGSAFSELGLVLNSDSGVGKGLQTFVDKMAEAVLSVAAWFAAWETGAGKAERIASENDAISASLAQFGDEVLFAGVIKMTAAVNESKAALKSATEDRSLLSKLNGEYLRNIEDATIALKNSERGLALYTKAINDNVVVTETAADVVKELTKEEKAALKVKEELAKVADEQAKNAKDVLAALNKEIKGLKLSAKQKKINLLLEQAQTDATTETGKAILEKVEILDQAAEAHKTAVEEIMKAVAAEDALVKATEEAATAAKKSAEDIAEAQADLVKENRESLSDFFTLLIADGANAWDTLLGGFKNMLTKMIAEAAANQILLSVGTIGSAAGAGTSAVGSVAGAVTGAGGTGGVGSVISGAASFLKGGVAGIGNSFITAGTNLAGLFPAGSAIQTGIAGYVSGVVELGNSALSSVGISGASAGTSALAGAGLNLAGGLAGSYVGGEVFGDTSGIGSTIGGVVGSVWGPVGAAIGSFIGTGLEKGLSNLFGFNQNDGNNSGKATFNSATGEIEAAGVGKTFDQQNVDSAGALAEVLVAFGKQNDSDFSGEVKVGNQFGFKLDGQKFKTASELTTAGFLKILDATDDLNPALRTLVAGFKGTVLETYKFSSSIVAIEKLLSKNVVGEISEMIESEQEQLRVTAFTAINRQFKRLEEMSEAYEGTAGQAERLSLALLENKTSLAAMVTAVYEISTEIDAAFGDTIQKLRDAAKSPEELQFSRLDELKNLENILPTLVDPAAIKETSDRILQLSNDIFSGLSEDEQKGSADLLADRLEETLGVVQDRLDNSLNIIGAREEEVNNKLNEILFTSAEMNAQAASTNVEAAEINSQAVQDFTEAVELFIKNGSVGAFAVNNNRNSEVV